MSRNFVSFVGLAFFALIGGVVFRAYLGGDSLLFDANQYRASVSSLVVDSGSGTNAIASVPAFVFARNLYFGMRSDNDVKQLQGFIADRGFYKGPITGNFFGLTLAGVKKMQAAYAITPVVGYVGSKTRAIMNDILAKAALAAVATSVKPAEAPIETPVVTHPFTPAPAPTAPLESSVKIAISYPAYTISSYRDQVLHEFKLQNGTSAGKIAVTKIKFKNVGTLRVGNIVSPRLINSLTSETLSTAEENSDGTIEFILTPNASLPDNGLMVFGGLYAIRADLRATNTIEKPYIILSIESVTDITAADFNNLNRSATLTAQNTFPVHGPKIALPY